MKRRKSKRELVRSLLGDAAAKVLHAAAWARQMPRLTTVAQRQLIATFVEPGDVCLDIGSNNGHWTYSMAQRVGRRGRVFAFEIFPYYQDVLRRALWFRGIAQVTILPGLSDEDGSVNIALRDEAGEVLVGTIHVATSTEKPREAVQVPVHRFDALVEREPELKRAVFAKIDIEGAELTMWRGATQLLTVARPVMYCEIVDEHCQRYGHGLRDVLQFLRQADYELFALEDDGRLRPVSVDTDPPHHDYVIVPAEKAIALETLCSS